DPPRGHGLHARRPRGVARGVPQGVTRADTLLDAVAHAIDEVGFQAHGVHVRVGDDAAARRWTAERREEIHSIAKAVAVLAVGIARDEGVLDPDAPVARHFPGAELGDGAGRMTTRHLLTMTSGEVARLGALIRDHGTTG